MSENKNTTGILPEQIAAIAAAAAQATMAEKASNANLAVLEINKKVQQRGITQQNYASKIKADMEANKNCTTITIGKVYKQYQPSFTATVNGCSVTIPANGQSYKIHNDFAVIILRRIRRLDDNIARMNAPESETIYEIKND